MKMILKKLIGGRHRFLIDILGCLFFAASLWQTILSIGALLAASILPDFSFYYRYTKLFIHGLNPYNPLHASIIPFNHPPLLLLVLTPFALIPIEYAQIVFTFSSLAVLIAAITVVLAHFSVPKTWVYLILGAVLLAFPTKFSLGMGQINLFVVSLLLLTFLFEQKGRTQLSGLCWAIACGLKLFPLTLALYFLVRKKFGVLIWGLGLFFGINLALILLSGWQSQYFATFIPSTFLTVDNSGSLYDQSLRAFLNRFSLQKISLFVSLATVLVLSAVSVRNYLRLQKGGNQPLASLTFFSLLLALTTIGNSYAWQHHFVMLYPGFITEAVYLLNRIQIGRSRLKSEARNPKSETNSNDLNPNVQNPSFGHLKIRILDYVSSFDIRISDLLRLFLLFLSTLLVGYHFPDIAHPPTTNPILISHTFVGTLILVGLLLIH